MALGVLLVSLCWEGVDESVRASGSLLAKLCEALMDWKAATSERQAEAKRCKRPDAPVMRFGNPSDSRLCVVLPSGWYVSIQTTNEVRNETL